MRLFGQMLRSARFARLCSFPVVLLLGAAGVLPAQTAPYVLPYTITSYAGGNTAYTAGGKCATNSKFIALNAAGDGCPAASVSVGADPHDVRVDGRGNVFYIDNSSPVLIHKISPQTTQQTVYTGNRTCSTGDTYGDGCPANDGAADNNTAILPTSDKLKAQRGLSIAPNGDLYMAGYNDYEIHRISAATGVLSLVAGTGTPATTATNGQATATGIGSSRGVGVDANGNVYIADTALNIVQVVYSGTGTIPGLTVTPQAGYIYALSAANTAGTKTVTSGVPVSTVIVDAPEDIQVDSNGNIYIADAGNNIVRAVYSGKGTLPGISNPIAGYIYTVAGNPTPLATGAANNSYPADGTTPTYNALTVNITDRKIALDSLNNLYIADSTNDVIWFVDNVTGSIRTIAGRFGQTPSTTDTYPCAAATDTIGDGCPGSQASIYAYVPSNDRMGVDPDNQGNVYLTDSEGNNAALSRIRKLISGFNFPATALAISAASAGTTQIVRIHFGPADTQAATNPFTVAGSGFTVGAATCTANTDTTTDCLVPVTFNPTIAGYQTATFTALSTAGVTVSYQLTGTGLGSSLAVDPGYLTAFSTTVNNAQGVTSDVAGNIYIVDTGNNRVLRSLNGGAATVFAGTGAAGYTGDGAAATAATLRAPTAVAVDYSGSVYITDTGNNVVRRVSPNGVITTYAGGSTACAVTTNACVATQTSFNAPTGIATDNVGQVYVADSGNNLIRQISASGFVYVLAGGGTTACSTQTDTANDGCAGLQGIFSAPYHLAFDSAGTFLVVADSGNNLVRKIFLGNTITASATFAGTAVVNPLTQVAGNLQAGTSISSSGAAISSQLNAPRGVAVDAAENVVIADTGNSAIRFVNNTTGSISTIAGVLGTSGAGTVPGNAGSTGLASPAAVALTGGNNLYIADSGNNRILTENRTQITYTFGRVNQGTTSPTAVFTETSTGSTSATLPALPYAMTGSTDFTLTSSATSGCSSGALAVGSGCLLNGMFMPSNSGTETATFTETGASGSTAASPNLTLTGVGAVLTNTTSTLAQTSPASGNPQFGSNFTLTATVTAQACNNTGAPACYPTGTVTFSIDGATAGAPVTLSTPGTTTATAATASQIISGLSTGSHTAACYYSGDEFYGASSCGNITLTVAQASTTAVLTAATSGAPQYPGTNCVTYTSTNAPSTGLVGATQCVGETLTATVTSNTSGIPSGSLSFYSGTSTIPLGGAAVPLNSKGVATLALTYTIDANGNLIAGSDATLPAGTYSLRCTYGGSANFATSNCANVTFTVAPQATNFTLVTRGCSLANLYAPGSNTPQQGGPCSSISGSGINDLTYSGAPLVATADGATTDATVFIDANNTVSGPVSISCSGLPQYSICTFSPSTLTLSSSAVYAGPVPIDVTLWTDIRPGNATSALRVPAVGKADGGNTRLALIFGWPVVLLGFGGVVRSRKARRGTLPWLAALLLMAGCATALSGCGLGGPGVDQVVLTPAGTYPITINVTVDGVTKSTLVYFKVGSPGIQGQQ